MAHWRLSGSQLADTCNVRPHSAGHNAMLLHDSPIPLLPVVQIAVHPECLVPFTFKKQHTAKAAVEALWIRLHAKRLHLQRSMPLAQIVQNMGKKQSYLGCLL